MGFWIVAWLAVAVLTSVPAVVVGWKRGEPPPPLWEVPRMTQTYTTIIGSLAGFSVASAIFMSGQSVTQGTDPFLPVIGLLLLAFMMFVATAMVFGTTPSLPVTATTPRAYEVAQASSFLFANCGFYLGVATSWLALRPLLQALGMDRLADVFSWLLLIPAFMGALRMALFARQTFSVRPASVLVLPLVAPGASLLYALVAAGQAGWWPVEEPRFTFAAVALVFGAVGLGGQAVLLGLYSNGSGLAWIDRVGHRLALVYVHCVAFTVMSLWYAVVSV